MNDFLINLSRVLAHTLVMEAKQGELFPAFNVFGSEWFSEKPKVPEFKPIDTSKVTQDTISSALGNFAGASDLAGKVNTFNQSELDKMMAAAIPNYQELKSGISSNISSFNRGELPPDVQAQIGRNDAFKALRGGYGGSGMNRNLVARDVGLTSLDLMQKGVDAGSRWLAASRALTAPQFNVTSMFLSPEQQLQTQMFNTQGQFQRDWMKNQIDQQYSFGSLLNADVAESNKAALDWYGKITGSMGGGMGG